MRVTRQQAVTDRLREMILRNELGGGDRLLEIQLSNLLGVSRTPIREAFIALAEEGLVEYRPNRGYIVRSFTIDTIMDAYVVREALEGLACRLMAERGLSREVKAQFKKCLADGDRILSVDRITEDLREPWGEVNSRFHQLLMNNTGNNSLVDALNRVTNRPYTSSKVVHWFKEDDAEGLFQLRTVHAQHHAIYDAICAGQGYRAEVAMRGHIEFAANHIRMKFQQRNGDLGGDESRTDLVINDGPDEDASMVRSSQPAVAIAPRSQRAPAKSEKRKRAVIG